MASWGCARLYSFSSPNRQGLQRVEETPGALNVYVCLPGRHPEPAGSQVACAGWQLPPAKSSRCNRGRHLPGNWSLRDVIEARNIPPAPPPRKQLCSKMPVRSLKHYRAWAKALLRRHITSPEHSTLFSKFSTRAVRYAGFRVNQKYHAVLSPADFKSVSYYSRMQNIWGLFTSDYQILRG